MQRRSRFRSCSQMHSRTRFRAGVMIRGWVYKSVPERLIVLLLLLIKSFQRLYNEGKAIELQLHKVGSQAMLGLKAGLTIAETSILLPFSSSAESISTRSLIRLRTADIISVESRSRSFYGCGRICTNIRMGQEGEERF